MVAITRRTFARVASLATGWSDRTRAIRPTPTSLPVASLSSSVASELSTPGSGSGWLGRIPGVGAPRTTAITKKTAVAARSRPGRRLATSPNLPSRPVSASRTVWIALTAARETRLGASFGASVTSSLVSPTSIESPGWITVG